MGYEKYKIDILMLSGVSLEQNSNYWHTPIVTVDSSHKAVFRLPTSINYPSWMVIRHASIGFGIYGSSAVVSLSHINPAESMAWLENEATWMNANSIPTLWVAPGVTNGTAISSLSTRGIGEDIYFNDGDILSDVVAAQGGVSTLVDRGYVLTCSSGYVSIDTIKNQSTPLLYLDLANPIISSVVPLSDNSGAGFSFYVYVLPGEEPVIEFDFMTAHVAGALVAIATSFSIENTLVDGSKIYKVNMPPVANGSYYVAAITASYEYRYSIPFVVGVDSLTNIVGTNSPIFSIGGVGVDSAGASGNILMLNLQNAILHSTAVGNPHSMTANDLGADSIISSINLSGTTVVNVNRLHPDVMTKTDHSNTSVTDHSDFVTALAAFGVTDVGILGLGGAPLVGSVKLECASAFMSYDVGNNSVLFDMEMDLHTGTPWRLYYTDGAGVVTELVLGAAGTVLQSQGAALAPHFVATAAIQHDMTDFIFHKANNWKLFYSDAAGHIQELALGTLGQMLTCQAPGNPPVFNNLPSILHSMTDVLYHQATPWRLFYSDAAGHIIELGLGTIGQVLTSGGAAAAPNWAAASSGTGTDNHIVRWHLTGVPSVQDSLNTIDDLGNQYIAGQLSVQGTAAVDAAAHVFLGPTYIAQYLQRSTANASGPVFVFRKSRGSAAIPGYAQTSDVISSTLHTVWNGSAFVSSAAETFTSTENHTAVKLGSSWKLQTVLTAAAALSDRIAIDGLGGITIGDGTNGNLKVNGATKANGVFYNGGSAPTDTTRLNYDGYLYATRMYNSVYNDLADFIPTTNKIAEVCYGKVYTMSADGYAYVASKRRAKNAIGIATDTYGYGLGQKKGDYQLPISVAGIVLAIMDKVYEPGTPLVNNRFGNLTKATWWDKIFFNERIIAKFLRTEKSKLWNGVPVLGRHWVKVK
jgi:hypothetical protein